MGGYVSCAFCRGYIESADHLFFGCFFSTPLWKTLMSKGLIPDHLLIGQILFVSVSVTREVII